MIDSLKSQVVNLKAIAKADSIINASYKVTIDLNEGALKTAKKRKLRAGFRWFGVGVGVGGIAAALIMAN